MVLRLSQVQGGRMGFNASHEFLGTLLLLLTETTVFERDGKVFRKGLKDTCVMLGESLRALLTYEQQTESAV